jgi:acetyl-CoA carboxylase beta subunit
MSPLPDLPIDFTVECPECGCECSVEDIEDNYDCCPECDYEFDMAEIEDY